MLDPLSALSLASAIVQFVDYGTRLISTAHEIRQSASGLTEETVELENIILDIHLVNEKVQAAGHLDSSSRSGAIKALAKNCDNVAEELLSLVKSLKETNSQFKSWASFKQALRTLRKHDEIKKLVARLDRIRSELMLSLLSALATNESGIMAAVNKLTQELEATHTATLTAIRRSKDDLTVALKRAVKESEGVRSDELTTKLDSMAHAASTAATFKAILNSLRYDEMPMRYTQISESYHLTNEWILRAGGSPFKAWLEESTNDIFWISGKAGSGKSTLMKFLSGHEQLQMCLRAWTQPSRPSEDIRPTRNLAVIGHYFWNAGFSVQKSLLGLFQSMVYHIFRQCPDVVPTACPTRWERDSNFHERPEPWTLPELSRILDVLLSITEWPSCFAFFIDGLDELAGGSNEQYEMTQHIKRIACHRCVKICVSSRPWTVFEGQFGGDPRRTIRLQEHNKVDLDIYISGKLEGDPRFRKLAKDDERTQELAVEIRDRAEGVFLWVALVVRSLLDGLSEHDDVEDLKQRLRALPATLEEYFAHILRRMDRNYKQCTARAFLLACHSGQPLPVFPYYYIKAEIDDPGYAISAPIRTRALQWNHNQRTNVVLWINKWCRDLLEVSQWQYTMESRWTGRYHIDFLHRTARDFLMEEEIHKSLVADAGHEFNHRLSLCRSYLAQAKNRLQGPEAGDKFRYLAKNVLSFAYKREVFDRKTPLKILDELDRTGNEIARPSPALHWTSNYALPDIQLRPSDYDLLVFAVERKLELYVKKSLTKLPRSERSKTAKRILFGTELLIRSEQIHRKCQKRNLPSGMAVLFEKYIEDYDEH